MKRILSALTIAALLAAACEKAPSEGPAHLTVADGRIVFYAGDADGASTKAVTASTASSLQADGFRVAAVTGTTQFFNEPVSWVAADGWYTTATPYYYPSAPTSFYAAYPKSQAITVSAAGAATLSYTSDNATDLLAAKATGVEKRDTPQPLTFGHVLSQVVVKAQGSDTDVSYRVKTVTLSNSTAGIYSYALDAWSGTNKSKTTDIVTSNTDVGTASMSGALGIGAVTVVPAEVTLRITWDCLQGGVVVASYDKSVNVTPTKGRICTVNCTLPNADAKRIKFTVTVNAWGDESRNLTLS